MEYVLTFYVNKQTNTYVIRFSFGFCLLGFFFIIQQLYSPMIILLIVFRTYVRFPLSLFVLRRMTGTKLKIVFSLALERRPNETEHEPTDNDMPP